MCELKVACAQKTVAQIICETLTEQLRYVPKSRDSASSHSTCLANNTKL